MPSPAPFQRFTKDSDTPEVIVSALRHWLPELSWSKTRQLLRKRRVAVGGSLCLNEGRKLKTGEVVDVFEHPLPAPPSTDDVTVHFCDRDLVIVEKPSGMTTLRHRAERGWPQWKKALQPTLEEVVPDLIYSADRRHRPPLFSVHRIDRDTSGLLVFARSQAIQQKLIEQFANHDVVRVYHALIPETVTEQTIRTHLVRDRGDGLRGSNPDGQGQVAVTHVTPLRTFPAADDGSSLSEIECRLETGRTHQIRIHLAELGHPVCGDPVYRGPLGATAVTDVSHAPRLALHAAQIGFTHPNSGQVIHFETTWPQEMKRYLHRLLER